MNVTTLII